MTNRKHNSNYRWMLACSFVLSLAWSGLLNAAETESEIQVAIRPSSIQAGLQRPARPRFRLINDSNYFGDEYRPDNTDGPPTYTEPAQPSPAERQQLEISSRYQDPRMLGYLQNSSMNQIMSLYNEASRLIDSRHVSPLSYEERTSQGD